MRNAKLTTSRTNKRTITNKLYTKTQSYIQAQIKGLCNLTLQNVGYQ